MALIACKMKVLAAGWAVSGLLAVPGHATELRPETAAAFDRYIRATEERMGEDSKEDRFLLIDRQPNGRRQEVYAQVRHGQVYIEQFRTKEDGKSIQVPDGLIHHWVGVAFIQGATVGQTLAVLQDYDNHKNVYKPDVRNSKLLERNGNEFKVYLQLYRKSLVTVVMNINLDIQYTLPDATHAMSKSHSTRIAEVENAGEPGEHELPVGNDHGYIWRLYSYWRIEEKDGGVYVQVESVGLSRSIPWVFAWLINPLTRSIPREVVSRLLNATRAAVTTSQKRSAGFLNPGHLLGSDERAVGASPGPKRAILSSQKTRPGPRP